MTNDLSHLKPVRRDGTEPFHSNGRPTGLTVLDFWRWSESDLVSNVRRGVLAEFIVAGALGIAGDGVRDEWGAFDLMTPEGITVEVKSAAYVQSWTQHSYSSILFHVPKTRAWSADSNLQETTSRRQAQVYVFALLAHQDKATIDPLNIDQWRFYVLPTAALDERRRSQHSITLKSLEKLAGAPIPYEGLREAVRQAAQGGEVN